MHAQGNSAICSAWSLLQGQLRSPKLAIGFNRRHTFNLCQFLVKSLNIPTKSNIRRKMITNYHLQQNVQPLALNGFMASIQKMLTFGGYLQYDLIMEKDCKIQRQTWCLVLQTKWELGILHCRRMQRVKMEANRSRSGGAWFGTKQKMLKHAFVMWTGSMAIENILQVQCRFWRKGLPFCGDNESASNT